MKLFAKKGDTIVIYKETHSVDGKSSVKEGVYVVDSVAPPSRDTGFSPIYMIRVGNEIVGVSAKNAYDGTIPLKTGDVLYDASMRGVNKFTFLTTVPYKSNDVKNKYFIFLDDNELPVRLHRREVCTILDKQLLTYDQATDEHVRILQGHIDFLKNRKK